MGASARRMEYLQWRRRRRRRRLDMGEGPGESCSKVDDDGGVLTKEGRRGGEGSVEQKIA